MAPVLKVQLGWFNYDGWLNVCSPIPIPRQLRFSLYSGAVITGGLIELYYFFIAVLSS